MVQYVLYQPNKKVYFSKEEKETNNIKECKTFDKIETALYNMGILNYQKKEKDFYQCIPINY